MGSDVVVQHTLLFLTFEPKLCVTDAFVYVKDLLHAFLGDVHKRPEYYVEVFLKRFYIRCSSQNSLFFSTYSVELIFFVIDEDFVGLQDFNFSFQDDVEKITLFAFVENFGAAFDVQKTDDVR